jgi:hypothetical protein
VDHRGVDDAVVLERLPELRVREDHALQRGLVVNPGQLVLFEEVPGVVRALPHQLANVLGAVIDVEVPGPAHAGAPFLNENGGFRLAGRQPS